MPLKGLLSVLCDIRRRQVGKRLCFRIHLYALAAVCGQLDIGHDLHVVRQSQGIDGVAALLLHGTIVRRHLCQAEIFEHRDRAHAELIPRPVSGVAWIGGVVADGDREGPVAADPVIFCRPAVILTRIKTDARLPEEEVRRRHPLLVGAVLPRIPHSVAARNLPLTAAVDKVRCKQQSALPARQVVLALVGDVRLRLSAPIPKQDGETVFPFYEVIGDVDHIIVCVCGIGTVQPAFKYHLLAVDIQIRLGIGGYPQFCAGRHLRQSKIAPEIYPLTIFGPDIFYPDPVRRAPPLRFGKLRPGCRRPAGCGTQCKCQRQEEGDEPPSNFADPFFILHPRHPPSAPCFRCGQLFPP